MLQETYIPMTLGQIIRRFKIPIGVVVLFLLIENIAWIIEPGFFGKLLDALIDHFYDHEKVSYTTPLLFWIMIYLINVAGGALGRFYSGKIYSRMYADIATQMDIRSRAGNHPPSKTLARAELAREYINFLKDRIPEILWQASATIGVIIALFFYDWRIALVMLVIIIPVLHINRLYRMHVTRLQKNIHDNREELFGVFETMEIAAIADFYSSMVKPQTSIARWNSINYGILKFLLMIIFIVILFIAVDVDNFTTGKIYAIVAYIWTFISSIDYLPGLLESMSEVRELSRRFSKDTPVNQPSLS